VSVAAAVTSAAVALCVLAAALAGARALRGENHAPAAAVGALVLFVLIAQTATAWSWERASGLAVRPLLPADVAWVDHHSDGPVAAIIASGNSPTLAAVDFFNASITRVYAPPALPGPTIQGAVCSWRFDAGGVLRFPAGCPPQTDRFWIDDPVVHLRFRDEVATAISPRLGRIATVRGAPRLESLVVVPCPNLGVRQEPITGRPIPDGVPQPCSEKLDVSLWLDDPATLLVTVRGAPGTDNGVVVGRRAYRVRAGRRTTIRVRVPAGARRRTFELDWSQASPADPAIVGVGLEQDGRRRSLL
jgi:hypothetical protein